MTGDYGAEINQGNDTQPINRCLAWTKTRMGAAQIGKRTEEFGRRPPVYKGIQTQNHSSTDGADDEQAIDVKGDSADETLLESR